MQFQELMHNPWKKAPEPHWMVAGHEWPLDEKQSMYAALGVLAILVMVVVAVMLLGRKKEDENGMTRRQRSSVRH